MISPLFFSFFFCFPSSVEIRNKCFLSYPPAPFSFRPVPGRFAFPSPILCDRMCLCCVWSIYLVPHHDCVLWVYAWIDKFLLLPPHAKNFLSPFFSLLFSFGRWEDRSTDGQTEIWVSCYNRFFWCVLVACFLLGKKENGLEGFSLRNLFSLLIPRTLFCMQFS